MELQYIKVEKKREKTSANFVCPHNDAVVCRKKTCYHCGWNPKVAQIRTEVIAREGV